MRQTGQFRVELMKQSTRLIHRTCPIETLIRAFRVGYSCLITHVPILYYGSPLLAVLKPSGRLEGHLRVRAVCTARNERCRLRGARRAVCVHVAKWHPCNSAVFWSKCNFSSWLMGQGLPEVMSVRFSYVIIRNIHLRPLFCGSISDSGRVLEPSVFHFLGSGTGLRPGLVGRS